MVDFKFNEEFVGMFFFLSIIATKFANPWVPLRSFLSAYTTIVIWYIYNSICLKFNHKFDISLSFNSLRFHFKTIGSYGSDLSLKIIIARNLDLDNPTFPLLPPPPTFPFSWSLSSCVINRKLSYSYFSNISKLGIFSI